MNTYWGFPSSQNCLRICIYLCVSQWEYVYLQTLGRYGALLMKKKLINNFLSVVFSNAGFEKLLYVRMYVREKLVVV